MIAGFVFIWVGLAALLMASAMLNAANAAK
jgi:hypothetical protein